MELLAGLHEAAGCSLRLIAVCVGALLVYIVPKRLAGLHGAAGCSLRLVAVCVGVLLVSIVPKGWQDCMELLAGLELLPAH